MFDNNAINNIISAAINNIKFKLFGFCTFPTLSFSLYLLPTNNDTALLHIKNLFALNNIYPAKNIIIISCILIFSLYAIKPITAITIGKTHSISSSLLLIFTGAHSNIPA